MSRFLCLLFFVAFPLFSVAEVDAYRLGAGDLISISVYDEPDLDIEMRIGLSGSISYPFLGDVAVSGLSPSELEKKLTSGLKGQYLIDPNITVSIIEYRPFYVIGEVEKPGSYAFHPGLTVNRAISIAGGFTDRASRSSIYVIDDQQKLKELMQPDSVEDEQKRKKVKLFDFVQPGSVITVEQSFF